MTAFSLQIQLTPSLLLPPLLVVGLLIMPAAAAGDEPDFLDVIQKNEAQFALIGSDADALTLFSSRLVPLLRLVESKESPDAAGAAVHLTGELAAWRLARIIKEAAEGRDAVKIRAVLAQSASQKPWLLADRASLREAVQLAEALSAFGAETGSDAATGHLDSSYAAYLDRTYPDLTGPEPSWVALAVVEGSDGVRRRLHEFWNNPATQQQDRERLRNMEDAQALRYFSSRLGPVLRAHAVAAAIRAESTAEQQARRLWSSLRHWGEALREKKSLTRLCGTWQWTVHNHKNHQDHKIMMRFDPPEAPSSSQPRPMKIVVLGDSVYLRWEFQGGYQEDSLLFTGEGQRLEGTFVNSAGAWGAITGKRVAPCAGS